MRPVAAEAAEHIPKETSHGPFERETIVAARYRAGLSLDDAEIHLESRGAHWNVIVTTIKTPYSVTTAAGTMKPTRSAHEMCSGNGDHGPRGNSGRAPERIPLDENFVLEFSQSLGLPSRALWVNPGDTLGAPGQSKVPAHGCQQ